MLVLPLWGSMFLAGCKHSSQKSGTPPLTLFYNSEEQGTEKNVISQILQAQLQQHGIATKLDPVSNTIFNDRLGKQDFQSTLSLWYLDYNDPEGFLTDFYSKAGFRMAKYSNPDFDREYLAGLFAGDLAERDIHFHRAEAILMKDLPWIPLFRNDELFFIAKDAQGFESNSFQYYDYRYVDKKAIHVASDVAVQTLDPAQAYDLGSKHVVTQSYEGLLALDASNRIIPALAESWKFSPSANQLTFHLRPNVHFHASAALPEGTLTSEDVRFSFERLLKENSPYSYIFDYVVGVGDFKAGKTPHVVGFLTPDPLTFTIALNRPFPTMLHWMLAPAASVVPHSLPHGYDFSKGSVGTGPFILRSFDGVTASFVANPAYYQRDVSGGRLPKAATMTLRVVQDPSALLAAFSQGDIDILNVPLALYPRFLLADGRPDPKWSAYTFRSVPLLNLKFVCFNMQASPWGTSADLRHHVEAAFDRDAIVTKVFRGHARAASSIVPPEMFQFDSDADASKAGARLQ
jgi:ABC-type transport system substrate-binding protein